MKISIVVPNYNGERLLGKNLPAVLDLGADEVIVVDDASNDNSKVKIKNAKLQFKIKNLQLIENEENLGFAKSVNRGVNAASGDVVILLNTDVGPQPGLLNVVIQHFKDKKVFGVSLNEERWSWSRGFWKDGFVEHEPGQRTNTTHPTFWVSGGSGAFRKSIWDALGGFDTVYAPFYWEDVDICYRAEKRGYKLLWEPKAKVDHKHESTIGKYFSKEYINFIQERNQLIFIWKNITSGKMIREHIRGLLRRCINSPGYGKVILAALSHLIYVLKARGVEKREARISDEEILG